MPSNFALFGKAMQQLGPAPLIQLGLYRLGLLAGYYRRSLNPTAWSTASPSAVPLFPVPSRERLLQVLEAAGKAAALGKADEIVDGKVRLFDGEPEQLQLAWPGPLRHWTAYETRPGMLDHLLTPVADIKFVWEPARFGWAFTLSCAFHLTNDERYAEAFWTYLEQFIDGNPPFLGPHWINGQEAAIRLMALVWCAQIFSGSRHTSPRRRARLAAFIAQHAARIRQTFIYARAQNNNHLITESAALFLAGCALANREWRRHGWRWLNWALCHQIGDYGEYIQHSTNYHRLMLQAALLVEAVLPQVGESWPAATSQSLARAAHWLFSMLDPATGRTPNLGANDGALILPLSVSSFADYRPTVQAAARAFLRSQLAPGPWDDLALWLGVSEKKRTHRSEDYLADNLRARQSWAFLRASSFKSRLTHMDQLHLDLWWRGMNIAQDAGTYSYNAEAPWNNPLIATRVHNTVMVDGREQMTRGGRFLTLDWFPAYSRTLIDSDERVMQRMTAYHDGYRGLRHERTVTVSSDEIWRVRDQVRARRPHTFRLHWLLPDWEWELDGSAHGVQIRLLSPRGPVLIVIEVDPNLPDMRVQHSLVRAGELVTGTRSQRPFEGWTSPTYGTKRPALSLAIEASSAAGLTFMTEFTFPK